MNAERRCWLAGALLAGIGAARAQDGAFERAMQDYEHARHAQAFDALARLADAGHAEAARIALLMASHGPRLYGRRFDVDGARRERWLDAAAPRATRSAVAGDGVRR
jgi:hypothetical protein